MFSLTISLGDILVVGGMVGHLVFFQFNQVRRVDRLRSDHDSLKGVVVELKHGRGLVIESFPPMVRRCFGYGGAEQ
jgi:hypothetical protein